MNKLIVLLSEDDLLYRSLLDNIDNPDISIVHIKDMESGAKFLSEHHKTTITIIDKWSCDSSFIENYSKYIFSFGALRLKNSLIFKKPVRLNDFVAEINKSIENNKLFCIINGNIYDEQNGTITFPTEMMHLTKKENAVIRELILSKDFFISREYLLKNIWKYSANSQTTTVETCMNKLYSKLPRGMLKQLNEGYQLYIQSFC